MILDGKSLAREIENALAARVLDYQQKSGGAPPALATLLVGDDPASATYVRMKHSACARVGIRSLPVHLPADTDETTLVEALERLNREPTIHRSKAVGEPPLMLGISVFQRTKIRLFR